jgi:surface polysaccharide O-acyltransferase-like enzyme
MGGKIGVDIFVLISGYFLVTSSKIKIFKILKLWLQLFFYSVLLYLVFILTGQEDFSIRTFINTCLPVLNSNWWFASTYFVLYLISPFINIFLKAMDKKQYQRFLCLLLVIWCFIPTFTRCDFQSNYLLWFIFLYSIAAYIRLWTDQSKLSEIYIYIYISIAVIALNFIVAAAFDVIGTKKPFFGTNATWFYGMQSIPILVISVCLFLGFKGMKIGFKKRINILSAATFGVYLIHDNQYVRSFLWKELFKNAAYSNTLFLIPYSIMVILIVYIGCTCIELIRIHCLEKWYLKYIRKFSDKIETIIEQFFSSKLFEWI